jgi:hypothetical protein
VPYSAPDWTKAQMAADWMFGSILGQPRNF